MTAIPSFRLIIVGSSGVGKTSILKRLVEDSFAEESLATIGLESESTVIMVDDRKVKLRIWDTAGQERFRSIAKAYYRKAVGVILVYDLTERTSFDDLTGWLADIHALCDANAVVQLIGNKSDLADRRLVTLSEAEAFAEHHRVQYLETSAKAGANVREAFVRIAAVILERGLKGVDGSGSQDLLLRGVGGLGAGPPPETGGRCC
jgi:small GTP-binding protein